MKRELGFQRWEAIGYNLTDGDFLGFNCADYRGAISAYEDAWCLLLTPWQRQTGGLDILQGIANFALRSNSPDLAAETLESLLPRLGLVADNSLRKACENLAILAGRNV